MRTFIAILLGAVFWQFDDHSRPDADRPSFDQGLERHVTMDHGAVIRGDSTQKKIALVFTGDEYFEGLASITRNLEKHNVKAGFFFTGNLYSNKRAKNLIKALAAEGHYLGPHSDKHILYNDWARRDSLLVTRDSLVRDIRANYKKMETLGISHERKLFIPPFEWWNDTTAGWLNAEGIKLVSFTWGIPTNADYTYPEMGARYRSSDAILDAFFKKELSGHLKGAIILLHVGTDPRRKDKLYTRLPEMIQKLKAKGYEFVRIDKFVD